MLISLVLLVQREGLELVARKLSGETRPENVGVEFERKRKGDRSQKPGRASNTQTNHETREKKGKRRRKGKRRKENLPSEWEKPAS